ncbi:DUF402 domain-containing protein [Paenibacillus hodogayensis]|uniref:DUF402 domain-containing protein n=1 Tax=Paenibacillus hodogayensis TaxID=279208 RepID=A0ABV5W4H6_9BACL
MIRKYADRNEWGKIEEEDITVVSVRTIGFSGTVTLVKLRKVKEPLYKQYDRNKICVAGSGYTWLQLFPEHANYNVTSIYDERNRIVQHTITICKSQGVTVKGVPWYDDLYLSLVVLPNRQLFVLHQDRLEDAVRRGELAEKDGELAWRTANLVMDEYRKGSFDLLLVADKHLDELVKGVKC